MPQDAFTLRLTARELDASLRGGRVNRINQPEKDEVSLLIYTGGRTLKLELNANASFCGVYFCEEERENPLNCPNFCMLLRKHLQGAELRSVEMCGFERILCFTFACTSDFSSCERVLYAEIMGKYSNLILTENGVILGALKTSSLDENVKRTVFAGVKYTLPAAQDKTDPTDLPALKETLAACGEDRAHFLFTHVAGLAPCTAEQIADSFRGGDLFEHVRDFLFSDEISPRVVERGGAAVDFFARSDVGIPFPTLLAAQTYFYAKKRSARERDALEKKLLSAVNGAVKKHEKRLAAALEKRLACADTELLRQKGELLIANLYALSRGMKGCEVYNYFDPNGASLKIALDERLTPAENAQAYFKRYRKQKRTLEAVEGQEREIRAELDYLYGVRAALSAADGTDDLRCVEEELKAEGLIAERGQPNKKKPPIPFRTYEKDGFRIFAGRNNLQNDRLVREASPDDVWLHAQKYHSCHAVIDTDKRAVPPAVLQFAADVCARYSDGGGDKIPVDYCLCKYVKKPKGGKAGFVTYSSFSTLLGDPAGVK